VNQSGSGGLQLIIDFDLIFRVNGLFVLKTI